MAIDLNFFLINYNIIITRFDGETGSRGGIAKGEDNNNLYTRTYEK